MPIDWEYIQQQYHAIKHELNELEAIDQWQVKPKALKLTSHKTKYGMADMGGVIYINQAFINSTAFKLLDATLRHEMAHLRVGLRHGHNAVFKAKAHQFKADLNQDLSAETIQIHEAIGFKYLLYATLANGEELLFRRAHRKNRKYSHYKAGRFRYLTIKGVKVTSFRYES